MNLFSTQDANGSYRPVFLGGTCEIFEALLGTAPLPGITPEPALVTLAGILNIINNQCI